LEFPFKTSANQWNTRLDYSTYKTHAIGSKYFLFIILLNINSLISIIVATAIKSTVPDCEIVFNKVPKIHAMAEIYCQLIPNDDDIRDFEIVPR